MTFRDRPPNSRSRSTAKAKPKPGIFSTTALENCAGHFQCPLRGGRSDSERKSLRLFEDFIHSDGEPKKRDSSIKKSAEGTYEAMANGGVVLASGNSNDRASHWAYDSNMPVGDDTWKVRCEDWMIIQHEAAMFIRANLSKLGIRREQVSIFFKKSTLTQTSAVPLTDRAA